MSNSLDFDAIVVGGGPAGATAAYFLAKKGYNTLLLERGKRYGSKNVYGGKIYSYYVKKLFPEFEKEAPIQRWVNRERYSITYNDSAVTFEYFSPQAPSFTAYLSDFTNWLCKKAEQQGATVISESKATGLIREGNKIVGVEAGEEKVKADVTIIAEGANRILLEKAGLVRPPDPMQVAVGIKETIKLDQKAINERFNIGDNEGLSWLFLGDVTNGLPDGAFLYTFKDAVSVGAVVTLGTAIDSINEHIYNFAEKLRIHPVMRNLLKDGEIVEYAAHLTVVDVESFIPEKLSGNGYMIIGDAGGLLANMGYTFRGVDFAMYSGYLAAEAYEKIRNNKESWNAFDSMVRSSSMFEEIMRYRKVHEVVKNPKLLTSYPKLLSDLMASKFHIEEKTATFKDAFFETLKKDNVGVVSLLRDLLNMVSSL
ncbi:FAD-dependent oxidoreductase [Fervidicoccus fontis]|uniref:FAD-dependent oxidoreductase n=1 Tax=Fervidicoccus fontis TaxID=683846 RepID=A0A7C2VNF5_9CREN|nr:FAD-dependent oxidoreductase [Fervidicoccus fontis]PMB76429.1 MAG: electron transfer flavoprotein [Fervidicoccus fontis]HEW63841.1 FAD-dependent oxidoreductase [Fervidicoccus fontis]